LEHDQIYRNLHPKGEPQLGKRGLYRPIGGHGDGGIDVLTLLWVLNLANGAHTLLDIADRAELRFVVVKQAAELLEAYALLREYPQVGVRGGRETNRRAFR